MTTLHGSRVTLRPFHADEFDLVLRRYVAEGPDRSLARRRRLHLSGTRTAFELLLAIEVEGRLAGEVQARCPEDAAPPGVFELGIELYEEGDRGRGLGSEVVQVLSSHLFEHEGAMRLQASTDVENVAMRRSLEKCGFIFEGVLRAFMPSAEGSRDYAMYGMTASDWRTAKDTWTSTS